MGADKIASGGGLVFLFTSIVMTIVISVIQEWVVVSFPPIKGCTENPIGRLGLYKTTFDPSCLKTTDVQTNYPDAFSTYGSLNYTETSTTDFWLLFPTQTGFGGLIPGVKASTDCKTFYKEDSEQMQAVGKYAQAVVAKGFNDVNAGLNTQYLTYKAGIKQITDGVDALLAKKWGDNLILASDNMLKGISESVAAISGGLKALRADLAKLVHTTIDDFDDLDTAITTDFSADTDAADTEKIFKAKPTTLIEVYTNLRVEALMKNRAGKTGEELAQIVQQLEPALQTLAAFKAECAAKTLDTLDTCLFQGIASKHTKSDDIDFSKFAKTLAVLKAKGGDTQVVAELLQDCVANTFETPKKCAGRVTGVPDDMAASFPLCKLVSLSSNGALNSDCSALSIFAFLQRDLDADVWKIGIKATNFIALIGEPFVTQTELEKMTWTQLKERLDGTTWQKDATTAQNAIPKNLDAKYALCGGLKLSSRTIECTTFNDFIKLAQTSNAALATFYTSYSNCLTAPATTVTLGASAKDRDVCQAVIGTGATKAAVTKFIAGDNVTALVAACEDDQTDIERINTAQILVPFGTGLQGVAFILAIVGVLAASTNGAKMIMVSGGVAIIGGILTLVALVLVKTAPVYQSVGLECKPMEACYEAGVATTLGYCAILFPILAGIFLIVAGCVSKNGEQTQIANKFDIDSPPEP